MTVSCVLAVALVSAAIGLHRDATAATVVARAADLADLSLEELGNVVVTSVSRRQERLAAAPASVYVISREDIRRSGVTSLPEALRLAPNRRCARGRTSMQSAAAALTRCWRQLWSDRGACFIRRSFRVSSGSADTLLKIDRIEVISGPGATLWGANAVNVVINVITRTAHATHGAAVGAGGGNREQGAFARYGAQLGSETSFRVYGKVSDRENSELADRRPVRDESDVAQIGFRLDSGNVSRSFTVQGDAYRGTSTGTLGSRHSRRQLPDLHAASADESRPSCRVLAQLFAITRQLQGESRPFDLDVQYGFALLRARRASRAATHRRTGVTIPHPGVSPPDRIEWRTLCAAKLTRARSEATLVSRSKAPVYRCEFLPTRGSLAARG